MFRFLPKKLTTECPDHIAGICYNILQTDLQFGSNSSKDNKTRPAISLRKRDSFLIVLPTTSQRNSDFFHLSQDDCLLKNKNTEKKDSYVSYYDESLTLDAISRSNKRGILDHSLRINIADWLKSKI